MNEILQSLCEQTPQFFPKDLATWVDTLFKIITTLAVGIGGIWALKKYADGQRLKAGEILLRTEEEFREILPIYGEIDDRATYDALVKPLLKKINANKSLTSVEVASLAAIDRCLRFFVVCAVLDKELNIERKSLVRCYHYYVGILVNDDRKSAFNRKDLIKYVEDFYPILHGWATDETNQNILIKLKKNHEEVTKVRSDSKSRTPG
jgi:hypothetical protein